jgi:hypothetical protein
MIAHGRPRAGRLPARAYVLAVLWLVLSSAPAAACDAGAAECPAPPEQPVSGPGGSTYAHGSVESHDVGTGAQSAIVFWPADPLPRVAPVVVFLHGWGAIDPAPYRGWISHLVRRGNIVVYPRYQENRLTPKTDFLPNATAGLREGLQWLAKGDAGIAADPRGVALIGHSLGGLLAPGLAATAARADLPRPLCVMSVEPGKSWGPPRLAVPVADFSDVPEGTLLLVLAGDRDRLVGEVDARRVFRETTRVADADKTYLLMRSDEYGVPPLIADHLAPTTRTPDALDFYGFWKLSAALVDAAFRGGDRRLVLGGTAESTFMGQWSDGRAAAPLEPGPVP